MAGIDNLKPFVKGDPRRINKPKGAIHLRTRIQRLGEDPNFKVWLRHPTEGYVEYNGEPVDAVIQAAWRLAAIGDKDAREWLAKYGWKHEIDITSDGEKLEGLVIIKNNDDSTLGVADQSS